MLLALLVLAVSAVALSLPLIARAAANTTRRLRGRAKARNGRTTLSAHDTTIRSAGSVGVGTAVLLLSLRG